MSNTKYRKSVQHEGNEQRFLFDWISYSLGKYPELDLLYHIPNGGSRNRAEAANLKRQGVKSGVPDLHLPVARGGYHSLYIELKYGSNKTTETQNKWLAALREQGNFTAVCYGWEEAKDTLIDYLKGEI